MLVMVNAYYFRTAEGQAAAYDATSAMPRKLKSLLKVVDGKTSLAVFASSLRAFGDVQGLLTSLQHAGLIELREQPEAAPAQAGSRAPAEPDSQPPSVGFASALASKIGFRAARSQADSFALTQAVHTQPPTLMQHHSGAIDTKQAQQQEQDMQLLVQDMSSFVLAYVPEQAFGVLSELEQISAMEQMAVLLGGYELIIRHVGEPARIHLLHVRQILSKWL